MPYILQKLLSEGDQFLHTRGKWITEGVTVTCKAGEASVESEKNSDEAIRVIPMANDKRNSRFIIQLLSCLESVANPT
jgi:hypothetical protein